MGNHSNLVSVSRVVSVSAYSGTRLAPADAARADREDVKAGCLAIVTDAMQPTAPGPRRPKGRRVILGSTIHSHGLQRQRPSTTKVTGSATHHRQVGESRCVTRGQCLLAHAPCWRLAPAGRAKPSHVAAVAFIDPIDHAHQRGIAQRDTAE